MHKLENWSHNDSLQLRIHPCGICMLCMWFWFHKPVPCHVCISTPQTCTCISGVLIATRAFILSNYVLFPMMPSSFFHDIQSWLGPNCVTPLAPCCVHNILVTPVFGDILMTIWTTGFACPSLRICRLPSCSVDSTDGNVFHSNDNFMG